MKRTHERGPHLDVRPRRAAVSAGRDRSRTRGPGDDAPHAPDLEQPGQASVAPVRSGDHECTAPLRDRAGGLDDRSIRLGARIWPDGILEFVSRTAGIHELHAVGGGGPPPSRSARSSGGPERCPVPAARPPGPPGGDFRWAQSRGERVYRATATAPLGGGASGEYLPPPFVVAALGHTRCGSAASGQWGGENTRSRRASQPVLGAGAFGARSATVFACGPPSAQRLRTGSVGLGTPNGRLGPMGNHRPLGAKTGAPRAPAGGG